MPDFSPFGEQSTALLDIVPEFASCNALKSGYRGPTLALREQSLALLDIVPEFA